MLRMRGLIMRSVNTALVWFNTCIFRVITTSQYLNVGLSAFFRPYKHIQSVTPGNQRQADCTTSSARQEKKLHLKTLLSILHKDHWPTTWNFQIISHLLPQSLVVFQSLDLNGNIRPETSMNYSSYIINLQFWTYKQNQPEILHHLLANARAAAMFRMFKSHLQLQKKKNLQFYMELLSKHWMFTVLISVKRAISSSSLSLMASWMVVDADSQEAQISM